jgi:hypothetical protein
MTFLKWPTFPSHRRLYTSSPQYNRMTSRCRHGRSICDLHLTSVNKLSIVGCSPHSLTLKPFRRRLKSITLFKKFGKKSNKKQNLKTLSSAGEVVSRKPVFSVFRIDILSKRLLLTLSVLLRETFRRYRPLRRRLLKHHFFLHLSKRINTPT